MKILEVASECAPFAKTGGLADVISALPKFLAQSGQEVDVVLPRYRRIPLTSLTPIIPSLSIPLGNRLRFCSIWSAEKSQGAGPNIFFVDCPEYFDREELYRDKAGDYSDNAERFSLLARAALEFSKHQGEAPGIIHCHDWQAAMIPVLLKHDYGQDRFFGRTATVFTIHNMGYQGLFDSHVIEAAGIPRSGFHMGGIEFYGKVNFLKGGIVFSDAVTTVSQKYSLEIQTPEFGHGLEGVVRSRAKDVYGILNGVDYSEWSPGVDPHIVKKYSPERLAGKQECKRDLLREFKLPEELNRPVIGIISRLADQKGFDIFAEGIDSLLAMNPLFVVLGSGETKYEDLLQRIAKVNDRQFGLRLGFDNNLAHKIEAGADIFLMPSRYEPCGLNQIYSLKYGTVPVVRSTGGLDDTVEPFNPSTGQGTGFKFKEYTAAALVRAVRDALDTYARKEKWRRLMRNGMSRDFSWNASVREYLQLFEKLLSVRRSGA